MILFKGECISKQCILYCPTRPTDNPFTPV